MTRRKICEDASQDNTPRFTFTSPARSDYEFVCQLDQHDVWCHRDIPRFRLYSADDEFRFLDDGAHKGYLDYNTEPSDGLRAVWAMKYGRPL
jgi:hypothetical protein